MTDLYDTLPTSQQLALELLAARYRCGDHSWTFASKNRQTLDRLRVHGLVSYDRGPEPGTYRASLTSAGLEAMLGADFKSGRQRLAEEVIEYLNTDTPKEWVRAWLASQT